MRQGLGIYPFRKQVTDGAPKEIPQSFGFRNRLEVSGRPALDPEANGSLQEFLRQRVGRDPRVGGQPPAELGNGLDTQAQSHPASTDQTAAKLVSVAYRRYQHDRFGERVGLVSRSQSRDDPVRLAAAGTAGQEGQPWHGSRSDPDCTGFRILLIRRKLGRMAAVNRASARRPEQGEYTRRLVSAMIGVLHPVSRLTPLLDQAQGLVAPGRELVGVHCVVQGRPFCAGKVAAEVPQRVAVEAEVAGVEEELPGAGHAPCIFPAAVLPLRSGLSFEVGQGDGALGETGCFARQVAAQVAAGDDPGAGVGVQGAVDLVEVAVVAKCSSQRASCRPGMLSRQSRCQWVHHGHSAGSKSTPMTGAPPMRKSGESRRWMASISAGSSA